MQGRATFDADEDAVAELLQSAAAMTHLEVVAWALVGQLRESSPKDSGRLSKSWSARLGRDIDGRPAAYVTTSVPYWHIPQYGSVQRTPLRYVDRAMERARIRYVPTPKGG